MGIITDIVAGAVAEIIEDTVEEGAATVVGAVAKGAGAVAKGFGTVAKGASKVAGAVGTGAKKTVGAVSGAIDKTFGDADTRHYKREQKYLASRFAKKFLIIQKDSTVIEHFTVYTIDEETKYTVVFGKASRTIPFRMTIIDSDHNDMEVIEPISDKTKNPVFRKRKVLDYSIMIRGQECAVLSERFIEKKELFSVAPYGWIIKEEKAGSSYFMYNGETEIMHFEKRSGYTCPTYILDFGDPKKEDVCLGIALIIIQLNSK